MNLVRINNEITAQLSRSAVRACINLPIRAIIIDTLSGRTGRYLAAFRGEKPVYAVCYRKSVMRQLGISYGIHAMYREPTINHESFLLGVLYYLEDRKWLCKEDMIVVIGGSFGAGQRRVVPRNRKRSKLGAQSAECTESLKQTNLSRESGTNSPG